MAASDMPMQSVRVVKSANSGRKLVFTSKFVRGQCILEELPYAYALHNNQRGLFCDFCLKQCLTLLRCSSCKYVSYCNKYCQKADWARCHKQDCKFGKILNKYSDAVHLLSQIIHRQRKTPLCTQDDEDCFPTTVDQLESHHEKLSDARRNEFHNFESTLSELNLKYCIEEDVPTEPSSLLKMYGATLCNGFTIFNDNATRIADGIYLRASMVNHSCDPNCTVVFDGMKLQIRTVKDVKEGEECTIGYIEITYPAKERQAELEELYHFTCKCVKCVEEINALGPDDGLGEELRGLKKSWEQIQDLMESHDYAKLLELCKPYLKPMDPSSSLPANHHLLMKVRSRAFGAYMLSQEFEEWEKAVEIGQLNTEPYRYHYGPYSTSLGLFLLDMSSLLLGLNRLQEARKYITEAEKVLEVTHGRQHSLMLTKVQEILDLCR